MKQKKENSLKNLMDNFDKNGGGTMVDSEFTSKDRKELKADLKKSFDSIFPELMKTTKHRKHVIFDDDIFQFFNVLCEDSGSKFSSMVNSALRSFVRERVLNSSKDKDPVAELLIIRERERELLREIKKLNLVKELQKKLG